MSQLHLAAFLNDVKGINPNFREPTSSLRGLIQYLRAAQAHPVKMTYPQAVQRCARFGGGRVDKYRPAIERLVGVWGDPWRPYPQAPRGNRLAEVDIRRICFRGDLRPPDEIFPQGFTRRDLDSTAATYRGGEVKESPGQTSAIDRIIGLKKAGDLLPSSAVCVTPDMHVAALFPLPMITVLNNFKPTEVDTWVYMVYVATGSHTHGRQVLDAIAGLDALRAIGPEGVGEYSPEEVTEARVNEILQNLYGREMATMQIAPASVWYGFRIRRSWHKTIRKSSWPQEVDGVQPPVVVGYEGDYKEGGTYTVLEVQANNAAVYPSSGWSSVASTLANELREGRPTFPMPTHRAGFVPSTIRDLLHA